MWLRALLVLAAAALTTILLLPAAGPAATPASYPSCGKYHNRNQPVTAVQRRVNACIVKASRDGRRARAVAVLTTDEGDPIAIYLFVRGKRDVLVVADSTRDAFGAREWSRSRCMRLSQDRLGHLSWSGCAELGVGKPPWLKPVKLG
jgi:hypothetical protein